MYRLSNDKRIQRSMEIISDSLLDLLQEKEFNQITISDVHKDCGVSRSTFYRSFDSTTDVLEYICYKGFLTALTENLSDIISKEKVVGQVVFEYWYHNSIVLEAIVQTGRADILYTSIKKSSFDIMRNNGISPEENRDFDYLVSIIASTMMGITATWIENGKKEGQLELGKTIHNCLEKIISYNIIG